MDPLDPSLSSAQRKLNRGVEHVYRLRAEADAFEHSNAYVARVERDVRSAKEIEYVVFAVERDQPALHWPLLAGEAIQNLRHALDHAVFAYTNSSSSQFPIFTDTCQFQVKGKPRIKGVPKPIRTLIEEAQPYRVVPKLPSRDRLAILNSLSNLDKHRTLATVASFVRFPYIGYSAEEAELEWEHPPREGNPLYDGAEVTRFVVRAKAEGTDMNVDPRFTYQAGMKQAGKSERVLPLISTLVSLAQRVFEVVTICETGLPISPGAQYPIYPLPPGQAASLAARAS